jgi:hypothetical protein
MATATRVTAATAVAANVASLTAALLVVCATATVLTATITMVAPAFASDVADGGGRGPGHDICTHLGNLHSLCVGASEWIKAVLVALALVAVSVEDERAFSILAFVEDEPYVRLSGFNAVIYMAVQRIY